MKNTVIQIIGLFLFIAGVCGQTEHTIIIDERIIHLKTFGKGTPILIINGGPGMNSNGFSSLAKALGEDYQAIIYDQRGTGRSTLLKIDTSTITLDLMVEDIETIRQYMGFEKWVVFGHSFGGMLASYYATKHPQVIKGIILSSSGGLDLQLLNNLDIRSRLTNQQIDSLNFWSARISEGDTSYHARYRRGMNLAPAYLHDTTFVPMVAHRLTQSNMEINRLVWRNMRTMEFDCKEELRKFNKPVLIIQGEQDLLDKDIAHTAHEVLSGSKLVFLPSCAHYGWLEQPEKYFSEIHDFMKQISDG